MRLSASAAFLCALIAFVGIPYVSSAMAGQPAYVGKWGNNQAQCRTGQEITNAPMLIRKGGYDLHEVHCTFRSITKKGSTWMMNTICSVEGDKQRGKLTLTMSGKHLIVDGNFKLERCR